MTTGLMLGAVNAGAAQLPDLAVDPKGHANFAWEDVVETNPAIKGRWRGASGTLSRIVPLSGENAVQTQVAVAPNGTATFVWRRFNGTNEIIQTRSRTANGALSGVQDLSAAGQNAFAPQVAVDTNGIATFVWTRFNGNRFIIQTRRRLANGTLEKAQGISPSDQSAFAPQVAVTPGGAATIVWRLDTASVIVQTRRRSTGGTFGAVQNLSPPGARNNPQVAVDSNDNASFVWLRFDGTHQIAQGRRRLADGALEATQDLSGPGASAVEPQLAVDPAGNATFVWTRNAIVEARRRLANGTFEGVQNLSAAGGVSFESQVAVAPDGAVTFAWRRNNGSTGLLVQTRRRLTNGTFTSTQNISKSGADAFDVRVGVDPTDNATFVWQRAGVIQTRRRTGTSFGATVDLSN